MAIMEVEGLELQMGDAASPEVFTAIAGVKDSPKIKISKSRRDRTEVSSTRQVIYPGLAQAEEFTLTLMYYDSNTQQDALRTIQGSEAARNFKVVGNDSPASEWAFTARVFDISTPGGPVDSDATIDVTFVLTTDVVET